MNYAKETEERLEKLLAECLENSRALKRKGTPDAKRMAENYNRTFTEITNELNRRRRT